MKKKKVVHKVVEKRMWSLVILMFLLTNAIYIILFGLIMYCMMWSVSDGFYKYALVVVFTLGWVYWNYSLSDCYLDTNIKVVAHKIVEVSKK